jgi:hypothetical protein
MHHEEAMRKPIDVARAVIVLATLVGSLLIAIDDPASAEPEPRWARRFLAKAEDVAVDAQDNTYVVGTRRVDNYDRAIVTKYGPKGRSLWRARWGPERLFTRDSQIDVSPDGSVVIAGTIARRGLCGGWYVRAYSADGDLRWHQEQAGARTCRRWDGPAAVAIGEDSIVLVGNEVSDGIGAFAGWIVALSLDGQVRWRRSFTVSGVPDGWYDQLSDVSVDDRGGIYVVGSAAPRKDDGSFGSYRRVVQKLTPSGVEIWSRVFDDRDQRSSDMDHATSVSIVGERLIVGGSVTRTGWKIPAAWIARLSLTGKVRTQRFERAAGWYGPEVALTRRGSTFVAWANRDGTVLMKLGASLDIVWRTVLADRGAEAMVAAGAHGVSTASNASIREFDRIWHFPARKSSR